MASNNKHVINDPVFGFITITNDFIYKLIRHPFLQRLNRIKQLGMASFAYPGAQHTRFHHSIGAMYLMHDAIYNLRTKGNEITPDEETAALACILLHDVGHGPFSHVLEHSLITSVSHEVLSLLLMERLNVEFDGKLDTCISIFKNEHPKHFLHQLVSGQLDVDRLDYLRRDCFFTGVTEGNIGSERIIKILDVRNDNLVVEAKGIYSIENFLLSRRLMYWQVYHHKTALAAEGLLKNTLLRAKELVANGAELFAPPALSYFLKQNITSKKLSDETIDNFIDLDDSDILSAVKVWTKNEDKVLATLSSAFIDRNLFKIEIQDSEFQESDKQIHIHNYISKLGLSEHEANYFVVSGTITTDIYNQNEEAIDILYNDESIRKISEVSDLLNIQLLSQKAEKYYLSYMQT